MLSNATYPAFDRDRPAVFSRRIVTDLLRGELGFGGVTITDSLAAPGVASPAAAVRATRAGVDLLLYVDERSSARGYRAAAARRCASGRLSAAQVRAVGGADRRAGALSGIRGGAIAPPWGPCEPARARRSWRT